MAEQTFDRVSAERQVALLRKSLSLLEAALGCGEASASSPPNPSRAVAPSPTGSEIVEDLKRLGELIGAAPTVEDWNTWADRPSEAKTASRRAAAVHGGKPTWTNALLAAGFDRKAEAIEARHPASPQETVEKESPRERADRVLDAVRRMVDESGEAPSQSDWNILPDRICECKSAVRWVAQGYGGPATWTRVLQMAGLGPRRNGSGWTDEECLDALRAYAKQTNDTPTAAEWDVAARTALQPIPSSSALRFRFGTWGKALEAAGMVPRITGRTKASEVERAQRLGRNRQMVTAGAKGAGPQRWDPGTSVESIRGAA